VAAIQGTDLPVMTTAQIVALGTDVAALTTAQIVALTTDQFDSMTTDQIAALTTTQIEAIQGTDIAVLTTAQIEALTTAQIAALTTAQIFVLTPAQVAAIETADIAAMTSEQFGTMKTSQFAALTTDQIAAIETADIAALTAAQLSHLSMAQHDAFTGGQLGAMSAEQLAALALSTPLVLDLNGDGVDTVGLSAGVEFDLNATGQAVATGWVSQDDGLLAIDLDGNGSIDDGRELFGSAFVLADGSTATNGFEALASLDDNGDGVVDGADGGFANLVVWKDVNQDGTSQGDELFDLSALGITGLGTGSTASTALDDGNWLGLTGSYSTADGATHALADVWFQTAPVETPAAPSPAADETALFSEDDFLMPPASDSQDWLL
jgi:hypothetical protein